MREVRGDGVLSAAGAAAVLVAALSFLPIVQGTDWWWAAVIFTVAATAVSAWARSLGAPTAAGALLGLTTMPLLATALDGQGRGVLLLFPTAASSRSVLQVLNDAWVQIYADTVPAEPSPGIVLLVAVGAATAAVLVDAVAVGLGAPLPAMLVVLALAIVPGKALHTGTSGWLLAGVAVAVLLVVAADRRRRGSAPRVVGLVTGGAAALVLALLAQVVLPAPFVTDAQGLPLQPLFGSGADPLIRLGDNLRRGPEVPVLTYSTTSTDDVYLRLAVLENFTGATWSPNEADRYGVGVNDHAPTAPGLADDSGPTVTTRITAASDDAIGQRLPLTYPAAQVDGVFGFDWDSRGLTLVRRDSTSTVGSYSVRSLAVDTSAARLKNATTSLPAADRGSIEVPGSVPAIIRTTASGWTKGATTPYEIALAIQNHLRSAPFAYDEQTPVQQGYDGDGLGVIAKFLAVKSGYCVHYASTMAVMARLEGIPARVVVGYQPGTRSIVNGHTVYTVTSNDLHAWPELYFDGFGWLRFEPTPGRGALATYAPQPGASQASDAAPNKADRVTATPSAVPSATASAAAGGGSGGKGGSALPGVLRSLGIGLLVVAVLLLPAGLRRSVRRRRIARLSRGAPAEVGWQEVLDTATDLAAAPKTGLSLRAAEAALRRTLGASPAAVAALGRIRAAYERQAYGGRDQQVAADDVMAVITAMGSAATLPARLRAGLVPRSLLGALPRARIRPLRPVVSRP
jgi:transglutaminase-like putative cysteine protease